MFSEWAEVMKTNSQGFTLTELVVSISLGTLVALAAYQFMFLHLTDYKIAYRRMERARIEGRLFAIMADISEALSSATLPGISFTHPLGLVQNSNNASLALSGSLAPEPNSTAISAISLQFEAALIVAVKLNSTMACGPHHSWGFDKSWLGLSAEGWREVQITPVAPPNPASNCTEITIRPSNNTIFPSSLNRLDLITKIIPAEIFSIYLAKSGEVRRLSHRGDELIENQQYSPV